MLENGDYLNRPKEKGLPAFKFSIRNGNSFTYTYTCDIY